MEYGRGDADTASLQSLSGELTRNNKESTTNITFLGSIIDCFLIQISWVGGVYSMRIVGVNTWPNRVSHVVFAWQLVGFKA